MQISLAKQTRIECPSCGSGENVTEWVAIDLEERPDLRQQLASWAWITRECPACGQAIRRKSPLVVTRLSPLAPILLALTYDGSEHGDDPTVGSEDLLAGVQARMGSSIRQQVPGPLLPLPFETLALAVTRDLAADIAQLDSVDRSGSAHPPAAADYLTFLRLVRDSATERRLQFALGQVFTVTSVDALRELFQNYPELRTPRAREIVSAELANATDDQNRHIMQARLAVLTSAAAGDFERAYAAYQEAVFQLSRDYLTPRIVSLFTKLDELEGRRDWAGFLRTAEELIEIGIHGAEHVEAPASVRAANALFEMPGAGRAERLERAMSLLRRAYDIYERRPDLTTRIGRSILLQNMAAVVGDRVYGDPVANLEEAIALLREALELITVDDDGRAWAMSQTNLGLALLRRAETRYRSQFDWMTQAQGDEEDVRASAEIEEAINHFNAALLWRTFERDARDWAYTQINLGVAYGKRRVGDPEQNVRLALQHYAEAYRGFVSAGESNHSAQCLHNMASETRNLALLPSTQQNERVALLDEAVAHGRSALSLRTLETDPVNAGKTSLLVGDCLVGLGRTDEAMVAYADALRGVSPASEPREAGRAARSLASLRERLGEWELAADAWEVAADAATNAWESRATSEGRREELDEHINVFRLAAFALAKAGRLERAVEVLELGRARQLITHVTRRQVDDERLRLLDPGLERRFRAAQEALATLERQDRAGIEVPIREAARVREEFAAVVELVRELPGFNSFLRQQKFADAASAIPARGALAYVLTTPNGSLVLLVSHEETGLNVTAIHAPLVTAGDLVRLFIQPDAKNGTLAGYMAVHRDESRLSEAISAFSPNIGEQLLAPLHQVLQRARVTDLCLVPIGLIGLLPLHAISWQQQRTRRCLLDDLTIRYAPSAAFQSIARIRATRPAGSGRAVIVGNPLPQSIPLDGAEFEARAVAAVVPADAVNLFVVEDATKSQVIHALPHAEYVHLACHGSASVFGPVLGGALYLANDEPLLAHEILEIDNFGPRLAVLSACETGVLQGYESADEVLSIGSMFLAAGAAGVVATLWSVDDLATALLMCKFYETLASENTGPADALRKAQLWLRGLTAEEEAEYICTRPLLRAQRATRGRSTRASSRPYTSVTKWGAFVFTGA